MIHKYKSLLTRFFVASALTTSFVSVSYGAVIEAEAPYETLARLGTFTIRDSESLGQSMAAAYLGKNEAKSNQIAQLQIETLESDFKRAHKPIETIVNERWEIVGDISGDKALFFDQFEAAQKQKLLLDIAIAKKEILEREKVEVDQYYRFFASSTQSLAIILRLKDFTMPPVPQGQSHSGASTIFSRLMKLNFLKGNIYFDVAAFINPRPLSGPGVSVAIDPYTTQIITSLGDLLGDIEHQEKDINEWLATLPKIKKTTQSYLDQACIQQSLLSAQYSPSCLKELKGSDLVSYRNRLEEISNIICERKLVLNALDNFSNLIDEIAEQFQKDIIGY